MAWPQSDAPEITRTEMAESILEGLKRQPIHSAINRGKESRRDFRVTLVEVLEVAEGIHFSIVPDEDWITRQIREERFPPLARDNCE